MSTNLIFKKGIQNLSTMACFYLKENTLNTWALWIFQIDTYRTVKWSLFFQSKFFCAMFHPLYVPISLRSSEFQKHCFLKVVLVALLHFYTPFILTISLQSFMLTNNHIESWVWKSSEKTLLTYKILKNLLKTIIKMV